MFKIISFIFVLVPSIFGIYFYNKLLNRKLSDKSFNLIKFFTYVFLSNMIAFLIFWIFKGTNENIYLKVSEYSNFAFLYASLLILINIFIGFVEYLFERYCEFKVDEKDKKAIKHNNKNN